MPAYRAFHIPNFIDLPNSVPASELLAEELKLAAEMLTNTHK
jgi:hypothetical protein